MTSRPSAARPTPSRETDAPGAPGPALRPVWMVIPTFDPVVGGAQTQARGQARSLRSRGVTVTFLTRRHSYAHPRGLPPLDRVDGLDVVRVPSWGPGPLGSLHFVARGFLHLALHGRGDIYYAHDRGAAGWLAVLAGRLLRGFSLVKLRSGLGVYEALGASSVRRRLLELQLRLADRVVVTNPDVAAFACGLGIQAERVTLLPNGVDVSRFREPTDEERLRARDTLGLGRREATVLYVGRLEPVKGIDVLLDAWTRLPESVRSRAELAVVGAGTLLGKTNPDAPSSEDVLFFGEQADIRPFYWAADLFVLPSRSEGLSNALLEAQACGVPSIVAETADSSGIVDDGVNGLRFRPTEPRALAAVLTRALQPARRWRSTRSAARARSIEYSDARTSETLYLACRRMASLGGDS